MDEKLLTVLEKSKSLGFFGTKTVTEQIQHSLRYAHSLDELPKNLILDLGAGGGIPSLPLLLNYPDLSAVLLDKSNKRTSFLVWAIHELNLTDRAEVVCADAVPYIRSNRNKFGAVVARGFASPSQTLECGAPGLLLGGKCLVSEPPEPRIWPSSGLEKLGLVQLKTKLGIAVFELVSKCSEIYPRSIKIMKRDPLFIVE